MKKSLFSSILTLILLLTSCSPKSYMVEAQYLDYSMYSANRIFITESNSVNFEYSPLGTIKINIYSGTVPHTNHWLDAKPQTGIRQLVDKAISVGANGIINLRIEPFTTVIGDEPRSGLSVSGMAIKRE